MSSQFKHLIVSGFLNRSIDIKCQYQTQSESPYIPSRISSPFKNQGYLRCRRQGNNSNALINHLPHLLFRPPLLQLNPPPLRQNNQTRHNLNLRKLPPYKLVLSPPQKTLPKQDRLPSEKGINAPLAGIRIFSGT